MSASIPHQAPPEPAPPDADPSDADPPDADPPELPPEAYAAALSGLPGMGPGRLARLLGTWPAQEAWARVTEDRLPPELAGRWTRPARASSPEAIWSAHRAAGVRVDVLGRPGYPEALAADHQAPAVLFRRGGDEALRHRRVAIVGSRRCTRYGHDLATELGADLASAGVSVVSGLALGVDGAAHRGALEAGGAPPLAVVATGLDVAYPPRHRDLWARVAQAGLVVGETPLGTRPEPWRFPVRNRVIAALAEVVVVVESHATGGSRYTVEAAIARDRTVLAVPGSVRSSASSYPNALLADGCHPVRDVTDVLLALGLSSATRPAAAANPDTVAPGDRAVLEALGWEPATLEDLVGATGLGPLEVSVVLARLESGGAVSCSSGWWQRRSGGGRAGGGRRPFS